MKKHIIYLSLISLLSLYLYFQVQRVYQFENAQLIVSFPRKVFMLSERQSERINKAQSSINEYILTPWHYFVHNAYWKSDTLVVSVETIKGVQAHTKKLKDIDIVYEQLIWMNDSNNPSTLYITEDGQVAKCFTNFGKDCETITP